MAKTSSKTASDKASDKTPSVKLGVAKYIKISQIMIANQAKWGNKSKSLSDLHQLLEKECGYDIPISSLRTIVKELKYNLKIVRTASSGGQKDRVRVLAAVVSDMFKSLEDEFELPEGSIGKKNGARAALRAITSGQTVSENGESDESD